jgi:predicted ribosome quality control (RQC) complex YloA/Tae2 family protein
MKDIMEGISPLPLNTSGLGRFVKKLRQPMKDGILVSVYEKQRSKAADTIAEQMDAINELVEALDDVKLEAVAIMAQVSVVRDTMKSMSLDEHQMRILQLVTSHIIDHANNILAKCKAQEQGDE